VFNTGVYLLGLPTTGIDAGGTLTITGNGGGGSSFNEGVRVIGGTLGGTLNLNGTASTGTTGVWNSGVYLLNVTTGASGSITGTGGGGNGFNHGVYAIGAGIGITPMGSTTDGNATSKDVGP